MKILSIPFLCLFLSVALAKDKGKIVSCKSFEFGKMSYEDVFKRYPNAKLANMHVGEGEFEQVIDLQDGRKIRLTDEKTKKLKIIYYSKDWKIDGVVGYGRTLKEVQKYNTKSFGLHGFGWDYGGSAFKWNSGKLECPYQFRVFFAMPERGDDAHNKALDKVLGEKVYSSMDKNMLMLNPKVFQIQQYIAQ